MPERTDHATPDEALRQVRASAPSPEAARLMLAFADQLSSHSPNAPFTDSGRLAAALTHATYGPGDTDTLERELLRHMPRVTGPITRGEYALKLRKAAGR